MGVSKSRKRANKRMRKRTHKMRGGGFFDRFGKKAKGIGAALRERQEMLDSEAKKRANAQAKAIANAQAKARANAGVNYTFKNVSKFNSAMVNAAQGPITGVNYVTNPPGSNAYLPPSAMNYRPAVGNPSLLGLAAGAAALSAGSGGAPQATAYPSIAQR